MEGIPADWRIRESLVEEAFDVIISNWLMTEWFRDGLMKFGTLTTDSFNHYQGAQAV